MEISKEINWTIEKGFETVFKSYYNALFRYAYQILQDEMQSEEIVQDLFMELWINRFEKYKQITHLQAYLYRVVNNKALNTLQHEKVKQKYAQYALNNASKSIGIENNLDANKLHQKIILGIQSLPEKCSIVFQKCRFEEKSYKEIAAELNISIKTVENQMSKAMKILRVHVKDYLIIVLIYLNNGGM